MRRPWTHVDDHTLTRLYATHSAGECAATLGRTVSAVQQRVNVLGLSKSPEWVAERVRQRWAEGKHESSRARHFTPGAAPFNKGRPQAEWMPTESRKRCQATQFRKGQMSGAAQHNYQPIGSLRVSKDGYLERKVTDDHPVPARRWVGVHRLVWEAANGPVPPDHAVAFLPGRRTASLDGITLDALELVSRAELMRRNTRHRFPKELADLIALRASLTRKINNRTKRREATKA